MQIVADVDNSDFYFRKWKPISFENGMAVPNGKIANLDDTKSEDISTNEWMRGCHTMNNSIGRHLTLLKTLERLQAQELHTRLRRKLFPLTFARLYAKACIPDGVKCHKLHFLSCFLGFLAVGVFS